MPRIQWTDLPIAIRDHLFDRLPDRRITVEDLYQLKLWRESEAEAPEGAWFKDFGSFKICGEGRFPKIFLLKGQAARREELSRLRHLAESEPLIMPPPPLDLPSSSEADIALQTITRKLPGRVR